MIHCLYFLFKSWMFFDGYCLFSACADVKAKGNNTQTHTSLHLYRRAHSTLGELEVSGAIVVTP